MFTTMAFNATEETIRDFSNCNKTNAVCVENLGTWNASIKSLFTDETGVQITILVVITILSILSNMLVVVVFCKRPSLLSKSNRFVLNLSLCNLFLGVLIMPVVIINIYNDMWSLGPKMCDLFSVLFTMLVCVSSLTLLCITLDRSYAVAKPLHYRRKVTTRKTYVYILSTWLLSLLFALILFTGFENTYNKNLKICFIDLNNRKMVTKVYIYIFSVLCFVLPLGFMLCTYINIFGATKRSTAKVRRYSVNPDTSKNTSSLTLNDIIPSRNVQDSFSTLQQVYLKLNSSRMKKVYIRLFHKDDWKAAITGFICVATFTVAWIPFFLIITLKVSVTTFSIPSWTETAAIYIAFLSCISNPLVYVFRSQYVKREVESLVKRRKSSSTSSTYPLIKDLYSFDSSPARLKYPRQSMPILKDELDLCKPLNPEFCLQYTTINEEKAALCTNDSDSRRNSTITVHSA